MEDLTGKTISHYRVSARLGAGGMGVVYGAEDTKLKRPVALKFISPELTTDPEAKERFVHEAQTASSFDHPSICTIHEIDETPDGQLFIVMPFYSGQTLDDRIRRGPLPLETALDISVRVVEGLAMAHGRGVVHRDIKPANIFVMDDGQVKILDFGLAKLGGLSKLTRPGFTVGTMAYMAPEQLKGEEVDGRADIWSMGVVLYETLSGRPPFKADYPEALIYSVLSTEPAPLGSGVGDPAGTLDRIITRALAKNRESRYQSAEDLLQALQGVRDGHAVAGDTEQRHSPKQVPSIAVLPFADLSPSRDQEYFCDGMAEEIINALTRVDGLKVVARTSAFAFKGKSDDIRDIGRRLSVQTVMEGGVRKAGDRLRITVQLVDVTDGYQLWSERFDRQLEDVFAVQDEISRAIVDKLKVELLHDEMVEVLKRSTSNVEAYQLYLEGRYHWNRRTATGLAKSIALFHKAVALDPGYALAHAGLADAYNILTGFGEGPDEELFKKAEDAAAKALSIDGRLAEAHTALAYARAGRWDWAGAERQYAKAMELNPDYAPAQQWFASYLVAMGRFDEALRRMKTARQLDPLSLIINLGEANVHYYAGQWDGAEEQCRKVLELDPGFALAHQRLGAIYLQKGAHERGLEELAVSANLLSGDRMPILPWLGFGYGIAGRASDAGKVLDELEALSRERHVPGTMFAMVYAGMGDKERVIRMLRKAFQERESSLITLKVEPVFRSLRSDPAFQAILEDMGLAGPPRRSASGAVLGENTHEKT